MQFLSYVVVYCYFTNLKSLTSQLNSLSPRVNYPVNGAFLEENFWWVLCQVHNYRQNIENQICDRSQSSQSDIEANDDIIKFQIPTDVNGDQQNSVSVSQQYTASSDTYESIILPVITGLSTNFLSKKGGMLDRSQVQLINAVVVGKDGSTITVKCFNITLDRREAYIDGSGLRYKRWWGHIVYRLIQSTIQRIFQSSKTGKYRFYVSDDRATVEFNKNPSSIDYTKLELIAQNNLSVYRNYWQKEFSSTPVYSIAEYIDLEEGQFYQVQINLTNGAGPGYITVSVEIYDLELEL